MIFARVAGGGLLSREEAASSLERMVTPRRMR